MKPPETRWRLRRVPGWPSALDVTVSVDTDSRVVRDAIESAAEAQGIVLEPMPPLYAIEVESDAARPGDL